MSKSKTYKRLISSKRWVILAAKKKIDANLKCSVCGTITGRLAVHHIIPAETAKTDQDMERLMFDECNLQVVCYKCHSDIHRNAGSRTKNGHKQAAAKDVERFIDKFVGTSDF